jgi:two-component system chemotaxis sensor kinase CheA
LGGIHIYSGAPTSRLNNLEADDATSLDALDRSIIFDHDQKECVQSALSTGLNVLSIHIQLLAETEMKYVRANIIYTHLKEQGEIIAFYPDLELKDLADALFIRVDCVVITNESQESIQKTLQQISQLAVIDIRPVTRQNLADFIEEPKFNAIPKAAQAELETKPIVESENKIQITQTVRVDVERLEGLLNLVGELIIDNTRLRDVRAKLNDQFKNNSNIIIMNDIANHLDRVIGDLQEGMMKTRMLPIDHLFGRFPRLIRDLAQKSNKQIELIMEGKDTELDRTLIEEISDPLIHILRNSADHGLENPEEREGFGKPRVGRIVIRASHQGNMVVITIADDGRGIDTEKVKEMTLRKGFATEDELDRMTEKELLFLIFRSGVSTADQVTELSGRGVGMDIVKSHIEKINGVIDIETTPNEGTIFTIKLPLTLAIIQSLLVKFGVSTFAIPLVNIIEIFHLKGNEVRLVQGKEVCTFRDQVLPLVRLHSKLQILHNVQKKEDRLFVVIVGVADKRVCLVVDQTIGNQEIVIKSLGKYIGNVPYIAGSTILGDGHVAHILDVGTIAREAGSSYESKSVDLKNGDPLLAKNKKYVTFQLADATFGLNINKVKEIIPVPVISSLVSVDNDVLGIINLRSLMLPVYDLRRSLGMVSIATSGKSRIMVCEVAGHEVGLLVDKVLEVNQFSDAEFEEAPDHVMRDADFVEGICKNEQQFIFMLNLEKIINLEIAI